MRWGCRARFNWGGDVFASQDDLGCCEESEFEEGGVGR